MFPKISNQPTNSNIPFCHSRSIKAPLQELFAKFRSAGCSIPEPLVLRRVLSSEGRIARDPSDFVCDAPRPFPRFFSQCFDSQGHNPDLNVSTFYPIDRESLFSTPIPEIRGIPAQSRQQYRDQQRAYVSKIRTALEPRPQSKELEEFDSTKDNPSNSLSARFGLKPDPSVYQYRLVSWGEAGSGIPLVNNPYSVRSRSAPAVNLSFKRKKFTSEQRETVSKAPYKQAIKNILNIGLHNSHGLASRFLGPETSANIAPATISNNKSRHWGQGEMQNLLEDALHRIEGKASERGVSLFLRCTDYLGKFGELQSRKIKIFFSEKVVDPKIRSELGNVKETTLGTFYLPGMINEPDASPFINTFKTEVGRLGHVVNLFLDRDSSDASSPPPMEVRYKFGICAQDLKESNYEKLMSGKQHRTNEGLAPVLQCGEAVQNVDTRRSGQPSGSSSSSTQASKQDAVFQEIQKIKGQSPILESGEELWRSADIEVALRHIRQPDFELSMKGKARAPASDFDLYSESGSQELSSISSDET